MSARDKRRLPSRPHCSSPFFIDGLEAYKDRTALVVPGGASWSYGELLERGEQIASAVGKGRALIFIEGRNHPASIAAYVGCLRDGHAVHLLDPSRKDDNRSLAEAFKPRAVIECAGESFSIRSGAEEEAGLHDELAMLLSTSGSTGSQKLVKLSYENIDANTRSIIQYLGLRADDRSITSLRFHYSYGMSVVNTHLAVGGALILTDLSLQSPEFWSLMKSQQVTNFAGVPYSFQVAAQMGMDLSDLPHLRFVTQAGGKLAPELVREFARMGREQGWRFYVMYGQAEAAPRISYLPPEFAEQYPDSIGIPVPGGEIEIVDEQGTQVTACNLPGELVYRGPNVMVGYARGAADLAHVEQIDRLFTGDLARRNEAGFCFISGRKARFVKPFGIRTNLDEMEAQLSGMGRLAIVGTDQEVVLFSDDPAIDESRLLKTLVSWYGFPASLFRVERLKAMPLLPNGKIDYRVLSEKAASKERQPLFSSMGGFAGLLRAFLSELYNLYFGRTSWSGIAQIFQVHFPRAHITPDASFSSLGGDSLLHVGVSLCLEDYLGFQNLPTDWHLWSIRQLEALHA